MKQRAEPRPRGNMPKPKPETTTVTLVKGVAGFCVYLSGLRIAGEKPWGGGDVVETWTIPVADVRTALKRRID
jgi:hypothetical protein